MKAFLLWLLLFVPLSYASDVMFWNGEFYQEQTPIKCQFCPNKATLIYKCKDIKDIIFSLCDECLLLCMTNGVNSDEEIQKDTDNKE